MKTQQQLADEYGVHRSTFYRRLKRANLSIRRGLISPKDQETIYEVLGIPEKKKSFRSY
ncbi:MAG: helix-turn-helix domain-containing protein [Microscillaceae bacterium]|nr:helix-turn-helix domain-containing protein [Microscillaceae bacterium]